MSKEERRPGFVVGLGVAIFLVALVVACSTPSPPPPAGTVEPASGAPRNGLVQSSSGGTVTIAVEWRGMEGTMLAFEVVMDTHSVDLDQYDLGKLAMLRDDAGKEYRPARWQSAPGGHHREGTLAFPLPESLSQSQAKYLEMVIADVAGIKERVLRWELE